MQTLFWNKKNKESIPPEERKWARKAHLSTLLLYPLTIFPLPNPILAVLVGLLPLTIFFSRKDKEYASRQALEAVYFQSLIALGHWGIYLGFSDDRVMFVFSSGFLALFHFFFVMIAVIRTSFGWNHSYPFSFIPYLKLKKRIVFSNKDKQKEFEEAIKDLMKIEDELNTLAKKEPHLNPYIQNLNQSFHGLRQAIHIKPEGYVYARQFLQLIPQQFLEILEKRNKLIQIGNQLKEQEHNQHLAELMEELQNLAIQIQNRIYKEEWNKLNIELKAMKKNLEYGGF